MPTVGADQPSTQEWLLPDPHPAAPEEAKRAERPDWEPPGVEPEQPDKVVADAAPNPTPPVSEPPPVDQPGPPANEPPLGPPVEELIANFESALESNGEIALRAVGHAESAASTALRAGAAAEAAGKWAEQSTSNARLANEIAEAAQQAAEANTRRTAELEVRNGEVEAAISSLGTLAGRLEADIAKLQARVVASERVAVRRAVIAEKSETDWQSFNERADRVVDRLRRLEESPTLIRPPA